MLPQPRGISILQIKRRIDAPDIPDLDKIEQVIRGGVCRKVKHTAIFRVLLRQPVGKLRQGLGWVDPD
ncbi:MAG: hypothetical protein HN341_15180 [Verrucomicrobia bacterium]|jgi:hypothetical protein|nr:hypothetical protein [Verrucomicrobiota bacterium]